jgi:hypothetical protein
MGTYLIALEGGWYNACTQTGYLWDLLVDIVELDLVLVVVVPQRQHIVGQRDNLGCNGSGKWEDRVSVLVCINNP